MEGKCAAGVSLMQPIEKSGFDVKPRHLVLVLIGEKFEEASRHGLGKDSRTRKYALLGARRCRDQSPEALSQRFILITLEFGRAKFDDVFEGRRQRRRLRDNIGNMRVACKRPAPGERRFVHRD